jgi:sugar phosphate permease
LTLPSEQTLFTIAWMFSNSDEKNIKLDIIPPTFIEEEISTGTSEYETSNDPDDIKLLRKLDLHLIPTMTLLYLLSYLDRVNIGQAKIDGLMESISLTSAQYNACLSVFFATYVVFEIPSNLVLKRLRPSRWIPMIMITWGIVMTLMGLVNSYGSLIACRLLLGAAESGLFPGKEVLLETYVVFHISRCRFLSVELV